MLKILTESITRIRKPLALDAIFQTTATEVRRLLCADRVAVFRFYPGENWEGEFVSEDVADGWISVLSERVYDHCFGEQFAPQYQEGRVQAVADIHSAGLSACHAEILEKFQVQANLVVPVLHGHYLWGLLCVHQCAGPREWQPDEIDFIQHIAEHFGVAVQQSEYIHKAEQQAIELSRKVARERALTETISKVRQSLEIEKLFQSVASELRHLLKVDRVAVFQFDPENDWEGEFVSEDVANGWTSVLAERVYDHCFGEQFASQYQQGRVQAVADIHTAGLSGCHAEILDKFQVRANLVVPVLQGEQLWGLLCAHQCGKARQWDEDDIEFVRRIAEHLSVALKQVSILNQLQYQAEQQKSLTGVINRIRKSLDLETIFETTVKEIRQLLNVDRASIFKFYPDDSWGGEFVAENHTAGLSSIIDERIQDHCFGENYSTLYQKGEVYVSANIYEAGLQSYHVQTLERFQVKANVAVPIIRDAEPWGLLCIHQCHATRQWQDSEVEFTRQIAEQLGVALQQEVQVDQLQSQAAQLADVAVREQSANRQKLIATTVGKIRQSLEFQEIFTTTTHEVRKILASERVAIYRFNPDWSGNFVAESMAEGWTPLVGLIPSIQDTYLIETQGGRYAQGESFSVNDIYQSGHASCHIALLEEFQARAYAIAPIMAGDRLWGLLAAYQNSAPRHWESEDVDLLAQIGDQLGVALQQAEAMAQVQHQAAALQKATNRQKALSRTIDKIRRSLDIDTIFTTTTLEVRQLLDVERVAIYRFNADWSGGFRRGFYYRQLETSNS